MRDIKEHSHSLFSSQTNADRAITWGIYGFLIQDACEETTWSQLLGSGLSDAGCLAHVKAPSPRQFLIALWHHCRRWYYSMSRISRCVRQQRAKLITVEDRKSYIDWTGCVLFLHVSAKQYRKVKGPKKECNGNGKQTRVETRGRVKRKSWIRLIELRSNLSFF